MAVSEADRLATLKSYDLLDTPPEGQFDAIVREAASRLAAPMSTITLIDEERQWFKARVGVDVPETPIGESIYAHAMRAGELFEVADASRDERFRDLPAVTREGGIRFYAGVPLRAGNGALLGTLCVVDDQGRAGLDSNERSLLESLARRATAAIELRREMAEEGTPTDTAGWLNQAAMLLAKAAVALERAGAGEPLAHLEQAIALVDARRD